MNYFLNFYSTQLMDITAKIMVVFFKAVKCIYIFSNKDNGNQK